MPPDPEIAAEARSWLKKALVDLRAGRFELGAAPSLNTDIVFHAQQAGEKSLKAFLTFHSREFRKTHNLVELGEACVRLDPTLESLLRSAASLTEYAWKFRYPGESEDPTNTEAVEALELAQAVYDAMVSRMPAETHPESPSLGF